MLVPFIRKSFDKVLVQDNESFVLLSHFFSNYSGIEGDVTILSLQEPGTK